MQEKALLLLLIVAIVGAPLALLTTFSDGNHLTGLSADDSDDEEEDDIVVRVDLVEGWNFISAPYSRVDFEFDEENVCDISAVWHYSSRSQEYELITGEDIDYTTYEEGTEEYEEAYKRAHPLSGIRPGSGYWVYSNECTFYWEADPEIAEDIEYSDLGDSYDGTLREGWNQIGGTSVRLNLQEYRGDCDISVIYGFDPEKEYVLEDGTMARGDYVNPDFVIEPGQAYWAFVRGNGLCALGVPEEEGFDPGDEETVHTIPEFTFEETHVQSAYDVLIVSDSDSLSSEEQEWYNSLDADIVPYDKASYNLLSSYLNVYVVEYYGDFDVSILQRLFDYGLSLYLMGDASRYVEEMDVEEDS